MKIGNTEITLVNKELTAEEVKNNLTNFYDTCNKIFISESVFYSSEQLKKLKKDKQNKFI